MSAPLTFGSVCSGIEAASAAWSPLGWRCAFMSEIEAFPRAVLAHHYGDVPLHGDFTTIEAGQYAAIDVLVGGTPCQSFSLAGLRGGLDDDRGNLALEFLRLADRLRSRWVVWENVPGVLSSNGGRDFGAVIGGMVALGYGVAYRVLDAQFFGLPQRRKRVFVVGYLGDWRRAVAVLFEREGLFGNPPPSRQAGPGVAALTANGVGTCGADDNQAQAGHLIAADVAETLVSGGNRTGGDRPPGMSADTAASYLVAFGGNNTTGPIDVATAVNAHGGPHGRLDFETETFIASALRARDLSRGVDSDCTDTLIAHTLRGERFDSSEDGSGRGTPLIAEVDLAPTLRAGGHTASHANAGVPPAIAFAIQNSTRGADQNGLGVSSAADPMFTLDAASQHAVAFDPVQITSPNNRSNPSPGDPCHTLAATGKAPAITGAAVRRLTPLECERLQGFPDGYTDVPYRKKRAADGPRYKAIGNSMAVPVMRWIGARIAAVDALALIDEAV